MIYYNFSKIKSLPLSFKGNKMDVVGARWWKFDIHTHTPASFDYGKGDKTLDNITPRGWLIGFIDHGIECVAVTDHNTGSWIDKLKEAANELRDEGKVIHVFPGVEITANSNIHVLGIFDPSSTALDIETIIARSRFNGTRGDSDAVAELSAELIIKEIKEAGGIAIPAHIDMKAGLCTQHSSHTIKQVCEIADAVEIIYPEQETEDAPISRYTNLQLNLPSVIGSDAHHPNAIDRAFTWVKMSTPSIEGFKLALIDGGTSILRSDDINKNPNQTSNTRLHSVTIENTKYAGRPTPLIIKFSPWMSAVIGGRGSGKSSVLEFIRLGMDRTRDIKKLDDSNEIRRTFESFTKEYSSGESEGILLDNTKIECLYFKDSALYSLEWSGVDKKIVIKKKVDEDWIEEEGDVYSRFPIKIFSQKQVYDFAKNPNALLSLIDESSTVKYQEWKMRWEEEISNYLSLRSQLRKLQSQTSNKSLLQGQLSDTTQKISVLEKSGHQGVLTKFQSFESKNNTISQYRNDVKKLSESFFDLINEESAQLNLDNFDGKNDDEKEILGSLEALYLQLVQFKKNILDNIQVLDNQIIDFDEYYKSSKFKSEHQTAKNAKEELLTTLTNKGITTPNEHADLIELERSLQENIEKLDKLEVEISNLNDKISLSYRAIINIRKELTLNRIDFLNEHLSDNKAIKIEITPLCDQYNIDREFRNNIGKTDNTFTSDIYDSDKEVGFLYKLNSELKSTAKSSNNDLDDVFEILERFKYSIEGFASGGVFGQKLNKRFIDFMTNINPSIFDSIFTWFPEDSLKIKFHDGRKFKNVSQGSAGQKASAVLSFLLSYGSEPLILDQPEDDLDNGLISSLIVSKLHESKKERQIIVVTHNPNIVVNGDSEYVIALEERGQININASGALQEASVRRNVCEIMEGGELALQKRYNRMFNI